MPFLAGWLAAVAGRLLVSRVASETNGETGLLAAASVGGVGGGGVLLPDVWFVSPSRATVSLCLSLAHALARADRSEAAADLIRDSLIGF